MVRIISGIMVIGISLSGLVPHAIVQAETYNNLSPSKTLFAQANIAEAEKLMSEALRIFNSKETLTGRQQVKQQVLDKLEQALKISQLLKDRKKEMEILLSISDVYKKLNEDDKAEQYLNMARPLVSFLFQQGNEAVQQQALSKLKESLQLYESTGDKAAQIAALGAIINLYKKLGDDVQAQKYSNRRSELISQINSPKLSTDLQRGLANDRSQLQNVESSLYLAYISLENQVKLGDYDKAINSLDRIASEVNQLAPIYVNSGKNDEYQKIITYVQQMYPLYKGYMYYQSGNYQAALEYAEKVNDTAPTVRKDETKAVTLFYQGKLYYQLGEYQKALNYSRQSLPIFKSLGLDRQQQNEQALFVSEPEILMQMGKSYYQLGNNQEAINTYNQALAISGSNQKNKAEIFLLKGDAYKKTNDQQEALSNYQKALPLFASRLQLPQKNNTDFISISNINEFNEILTDTSPKLQIANTIYKIGKIYQESGNDNQAINYLKQASSNFEAIYKKSDEALARFDLATILRKEDKLKESLSEIDTAIKISENLRAKITSPNLRISYLATVQSYYRLKIDLLMQLHQQEPNQGYDVRALETSESARARGLLDLLTEAKADIKQGVDPQLLMREKAIQDELNVLEKRRVDILSRNITIPPELEQKETSLKQRYEQNRDQIRLKSPRYAAIVQPQPLKLPQIQQLLDNNTILLEYSLGEERSYLWLVTKNSINSYQLPKAADIKSIVDKYRSIITGKDEYPTVQGSINEIAPQLKATLLSSVADKLTNKRLVVVADGALQYIPFGSLPTGQGNQPLLLTNEVINLPSASTLGILRKYNSTPSKAAKVIAVFADPVFTSNDNRITNAQVAKANERSNEIQSLQRAARENNIKFDRLTNTKTEAEAILKLIPSGRGKLNLDFAANLINASSSKLTDYRIIHFATHGLMDGLDPSRSGLVLSLFNEQGSAQNGYLRLQNIFNLKLDADLVVLSACKTGIGKDIQGEGLVGLTRGFMYAGTSRVLVSLWSVDDEATAILMSDFYEGILKKGLTPSSALRRAQQEMMKNLKYQSPYYWAAFTLQGEWK